VRFMEQPAKPADMEQPAKPADMEQPAKPADMEQPAKPAPTESVVPTKERQTRVRMSSLRQRIAERLIASQQTAAILTTFNEVDMTNVMATRARFRDAFKQKHGVDLGFMSFFIKAAVDALSVVPTVNAQIQGDEIVYNHFCDIGIAVGTEHGLVVPIIRDADRLGYAELEKAIADLARRAKNRTLNLSDLQGGTFTISNGGVYGSLLSTPILNPPQSGILGMHGIKKRPVVVDDEIVIRPMMYLALSYDHRLVDGKEAVTFLRRVVDCIESPERTMLEV
jgi:2-oxoglutarate dehydrogenase E2 component (dihydrolipoamide succinyltransferase)